MKMLHKSLNLVIALLIIFSACVAPFIHSHITDALADTVWTAPSGYGYGYGLACDGTYLYASSYKSPAVVFKIDCATMSTQGNWTGASGQNSPRCIIYDGTYIYVALSTSPGKVVKINPSTMATVSTWTGTSGQDYSYSLAYDSTYVYVLLGTSPAKVVQITKSTMTTYDSWTGTNQDTNVGGLLNGQSLALYGSYLYVGLINTGTGYPQVEKLAVSGMDHVSVWTGTSPDNYTQYVGCDGTYVYAIIYPASSNNVIKINISTMSTTTVTTSIHGCNGTADYADAGLLYDSYLYVMPYSKPIYLEKLDTSDMSISSYWMSGECDDGMQIVTDGTDFYCSDEMYPFHVTKIGSFTTCSAPTPTASPTPSPSPSPSPTPAPGDCTITTVTEEASSLGNTSVTLSGSFTGANTTSVWTHFEYGTSTSYGSNTTATLISTGNTSISQLTTGYTYALYSGGYTKIGEYFQDFPNSYIYSVQFSLKKVGTPTGNLSVIVRDSLYKSTMGSLGTLDVATLTGTSAWYTFSYAWGVHVPFSSGNPNFIISLEYSGGNSSSYVLVDAGSDYPSGYYNGYIMTYNSGSWCSASCPIGYDLTWATLTYKGTVGEFSKEVSGLSPSTTYHYRAVATYNNSTYCYGADMWFTTTSGDCPQVATVVAYAFTTRAQVYGTCASACVSSVDYEGFVWDTSSHGVPTIGKGDYNWIYYTYDNEAGWYYQIEDLTPGTTYYYRALVRYDGSWYYGAEKSFTTSASTPDIQTEDAASITTTTAVLQSLLSGLGGYTYVWLSYEYGLTTSYGTTTSEQYITATGWKQSPTVSGLSSDTTYHYRVVCRYNGTNYVYGDDITFDTLSEASPEVQTGNATGFIPLSDSPRYYVTLQGTVTSLGDQSIVYVAFQYGETVGYGLGVTTWQPITSVTSFSSQIGSGHEIFSNTTYHYRAVLTYGSGSYVYGNDSEFTTPELSAPTVSTSTATNISYSGATLNMDVTSFGDYPYLYVFFQYGTSVSYNMSTSFVRVTGVGLFSADISSLSSSTLYHYRAVVYYWGSYAYGSDGNFTTLAGPTPTASPSPTPAASPPTGFIVVRGTGQAMLSWTKGSGSSHTLIRRSTSSYPTSTSEGVQVYFGTAIGFTDTGLTDSTGYYYTAWGYADGVYSSTYATAYAPPYAGAGTSVLATPDTLSLADIKVFSDYQVDGDQLVVFRYSITYTSTPEYQAQDFFAFEIFSNGTMIGKAPVKAWGTAPGSMYFSSETLSGSFVLVLTGIPSRWSVVPQTSISASSDDYDDDISNLDEWVFTEAEIIDEDWVTYTTGGRVLTDTACAAFNKGIPAISQVRVSLCTPNTDTIPEQPFLLPTPGPNLYEEQQQQISDDLLGTYITGAMDDTGNITGTGSGSGSSSRSMWWSMAAMVTMLALAGVTKDIAWGLSGGLSVLAVGFYFGGFPFAVIMIVISAALLLAVIKLWR